MVAQCLRAQVRGELLTSDGRTLASVSRPCLLPHRSPVVRVFRRAACGVAACCLFQRTGILVYWPLAPSLWPRDGLGGTVCQHTCVKKVVAGGRPVMHGWRCSAAQASQLLRVLLFQRDKELHGASASHDVLMLWCAGWRGARRWSCWA